MSTKGTVVEQAQALIEGESNLISALANVAAVIHAEWSEVALWSGFYLVQNDRLELGPFQGPVACTKIEYGKGVCGTSWKNNESIIVDDVHRHEGHIACSSFSNSEIVVPIINAKNLVVGVLDLDSDKFAAFTNDHKKDLELICTSIAQQFFN